MANHATRHLKKDRHSLLGYFGGIEFDQRCQASLCPESSAYAYLEGLGLQGKRYIVIHDGWDVTYRIKGIATKCWPTAHWEALIWMLRARCPDILLVQLGAETSRLLAGVDLCLVNETSLDQAAWILKHALLLVSCESGLVHLARALHTKSLVLFGPTDADFFSYGHNINLRPRECGNCWWTTPDWLARCPVGLKEPACMASITPVEVADRVLQHISSISKETYAVVGSGLYGTELLKQSHKILEEMFLRCGLEPVPIRAHAHSRESGLYLHASKQWEYLFVLAMLDDYALVPGVSLRIADLGGGRGALAAYLTTLGHQVTVYDIDYLWDHRGDQTVEQRYRAWVKEHGYRAEYGPLFNVPANDQEFDVVVSVSVLEHVPFKFFALKEALRIVKPGGLLVMTFDFIPDHAQVGENGGREEIFTPSLLGRTLSEFDIPFKMFGLEIIQRSVERIQADQVLGIPQGMTVAGIAIRKQASSGNSRQESASHG